MKSSDSIESFTLNGKRYSFTRSQVEKAVHNQPPRRIEKYKVSINGVYYPPKQVVERLTAQEPISFTTMDAQRILKKFGYVTETAYPSDEVGSVEGRTLSEQYFEYYLQSNGYFQFEFEPPLPGTTNRPDYRLTVGSEHVILEVKQFLVSANDFAGGSLFSGGIRGRSFDQYAPIRQKLDDARKKFGGLKDRVCCLVLFNVNKPWVSLDWQTVYGAMLGNITYRTPFNPATQEFDDSETAKGFGRDGKCGPGQNTTISAVIVLEALMLGERRFQCEINRLQREMNHQRLGWSEVFAARDKARGTERDTAISQWRVVVHENPWARNKLSRDLFRGRFDERFGDQGGDGSIQRIYVGEGVQELEALERESPPFNPSFRDFREISK